MRAGAWVALCAACGFAVGVATWTWLGGPFGWVSLAATLVGSGVGIATAARRGRATDAWRAPVAVGASALAGSAALWIAGPPTSERRTAAALGVAAAVAAVLAGRSVAGASGTERQRSSDRLAEVVGRLARPAALDEVLQQVVDALRAGPGRRAVELWQSEGDQLVLTHRTPLVDRPPVGVTAAAAAVAANTGVVGDTWLRTWLPALVPDASGADRTRAVSLATQGELAGVVVLRRDDGDPPFRAADDDQLARLQRPLAAALNQQRLTAALERSVGELQIRNAELQASRARLVSVADAERRRLERDLHDGAQARLTALAVRVQLARRLVGDDPTRADELLHAIEAELVDATAELRSLAHGIVPPLLLTGGLGDALRGAAARSPMDVRVDVPGTERHRPEIEGAVYYCCLEALQNAVKHAGPGATAVIGVRRVGEHLRFTVDDDGTGPSAGAAGGGQGLLNMADRIGALGGWVAIEPGPGGCGTRVVGQVPVDPVDPVDVAER